MKKYLGGLLVLLIALLLVGCDQLGIGGVTDTVEMPEEPVSETPVFETGSDEPQEEPDLGGGEPEVEEESNEEAPAPVEFVPIAVEELGIRTMVPADWPKIEDDPLLQNAWGPGQYRFVAFHSVAGDNVQEAMAQLLSTTVEDLEAGTIDGEYWEEEINGFPWAMYAIENADVGLAQTVSMRAHEGTIYVVSLFIESILKDAVQPYVLENFTIEDEMKAVASEASDTGEAEPGAAAADVSAGLVDTPWVLAAYNDGSGQMVDVLPDVQVTALFTADERISGFAGCNEYVSIYTVEDEGVSISVPAMTRNECADPPEIMLQETGFLSNMTTASAYEVAGSELHLLDEAGNVLLVFRSP